ncbi:uncharacterized protein LOC108915900 [Anoplophora glabripennis]|uniref:uncharacterized protein LOC108915900 n=1 Tax=Anoplophora glabripennis TaxID=217634 RepID=UPI0008747027|nr:uncharacterized protein LOC108915900 [Anoplophora glabripennis]
MDKKKKMSNYYCSVHGCSAWSKKNQELSFHLFPPAGRNKIHWTTKSGNRELIDVRKAWILNLKIGKSVSKYMCVCSRHFKEHDYFDFHQRKTRRLKRNAFPSENLPIVKSQLTYISNNQPGSLGLSRLKRIEEKLRSLL